MNTKTTMMALVAGGLFAGVAMAAVPSLKGGAEAAGTSGLKVKPLASSQAVPAATPQAQRYTWTRGDESGEVTHYVPRELWLQSQWGCQWKDRKDNVLTLATVTACCPEFDDDHADKSEILAKLKEKEAAFKEPTDALFAQWASQFTQKSVEAENLKSLAVSGVLAAKTVDFGTGTRGGAFFQTKDNRWRFVEFKLSQEAKPKEIETLLKRFISSVQVDKSAKSAAAGGEIVEGKWTTVKMPGYVFKTDLPKSQRGAFLKDTSKIMAAMRAAYRRYVPPQRPLQESTIRVFSTEEGYHTYMKESAGGDMPDSIGLWNPSLEELLIIAQGKSVAERRETMKIMRHEAFHQYLFYATGNGNHAMWFNEGHATFFENVLYSQKSDTVRFYEDAKDRRAGSVIQDPQKYADLLKTILYMDHNAFYGGSNAVVNDKYTAAWAVIYFLQKGAPSFEEFKDYRKVLSTYLEETQKGTDWKEATKIAWEGLEDRYAADFMRFWNKRAGARNYEPKPVPEPKAASETK